jgi:hypothetical protein
MKDIIVEGGWGMYPVLAFGAVSLLVSLRYALAPRRDWLPLIVGFATVTVLAGVLGAFRGVQTGIAHLDPNAPVDAWQQLSNLRESLHNVVVALVIATVDALLATVGTYWTARSAASRETLAPDATG